jgi:AraC-like DNA-binding protein
MQPQMLAVKNMVCPRCQRAVENALEQLSIPFQKVLIGEIYLNEDISDEDLSRLGESLNTIGLALLDNRRNVLIEKVKRFIMNKARNEVNAADSVKNLSVYLSENLFHEYTYLSSLFSCIEGRTIEKYFIEQRIERVKELLVYGEKNLSEIADELEYSSISHLSRQFKKITGLTPTHFLEIADERRKLASHS